MMTTRRHKKRRTYRVISRSARTSCTIFGWPVRPRARKNFFSRPSPSPPATLSTPSTKFTFTWFNWGAHLADYSAVFFYTFALVFVMEQNDNWQIQITRASWVTQWNSALHNIVSDRNIGDFCKCLSFWWQICICSIWIFFLRLCNCNNEGRTEETCWGWAFSAARRGRTSPRWSLARTSPSPSKIIILSEQIC